MTKQTQELLGLTNCFDRFVVADASPLGARPASWARAEEIEQRLSFDKFELAVVFLGDDYAPLLTRLGIPHRVFVRESPFGILASATYEIGHARTWGPEERLNAWTSLGLAPTLTRTRLEPPREALQCVSRRLSRTGVEDFVALHPFGRTEDQWWSLSAIPDFATTLRSRLGLATVVVGGGWQERRAMAGLPQPAPYLNLIGQLSLTELCALMELSRAVVSTDSGPLHIAGTMGRPGVGLFRASRSEHAHRYETIRPVIAPSEPDCQEACAWDGCAFRPCIQMNSISPDEVATALELQLTAPATEAPGSRPSR